PLPLDPNSYVPQASPVIDFTQLAGNFDPTIIPPMEQSQNPGMSGNAPALSPKFAAILAQLTHNQTMLQNSLIDVMNEVAHHPGQLGPDQSQPAHGSHVKLRDARIFNGKHNDVTPFISEVKCIIKFHPPSFPDDHSKVLYIGLHLKDGLPIE
ncbi:hypothetical protein H0H87_002426, partial [Tephrocybe sp. NHM501043]